MCGSAMPPVNSAAAEAGGPAGLEERLLRRPSRAASRPGRRPPRGTRRRAALPWRRRGAATRGTSRASSHSWRCGRRPRARTNVRVASSQRLLLRLTRTTSQQLLRDVTSRERSHSPSALACGSKRVLAATPSPSRPWTSTLTPCRLGSAKTSTSRSSASGQQPADRSTVTNWRSHCDCSVCRSPARTHRPTLASPPLSPERACTNVPERHPPGDGVVGDPGDRVGAAPGRAWSRPRGCTATGGSGTTSVLPSGRCTVCSTASRSTYAGR